MKFTVRLYFYWVSIFLTFFAGILLVVYLLWDFRPVLWQVGIVFFIVGMIPPAIITLFVAKRLDYMESDDVDPPSFSGQRTERFHFKGHTRQPFDEVLQRVDRGLGGYIKMEDKETLLAIVYPIRPRSQREQLMVGQLLILMKSVLGCEDNMQFILAAHST